MAHHPGAGAAAAFNHGEGLRLPETTSRCVADGATHSFEVANWTLLEGMGVGKYVASSTFSAGGFDWNIRFYPDGERADAAGHAGVFLSCLSLQAKDSVRTKYSVTMLDDQGKVHVSYENRKNTFSPPERQSLGYAKFVQKSKLKSSSHLTIRYDLVVIKEPPTECNGDRIVVPTSELDGHLLEHLLESGRGADVTLLVGGTEFRAHSVVLAARSPVFHAQLFGPMMDKDTQHMEVDDMEPAIFEMLLHFVYKGSLPPCNEEDYYDVATMQHLLVAADRYGLDTLKVMCEEKLCNCIDVKTVTSTLALAEQHYCERLKEACVKFMSTPGVTGVVMLTQGFKRLMVSCTPLALEKDHKDKKV